LLKKNMADNEQGEHPAEPNDDFDLQINIKDVDIELWGERDVELQEQIVFFLSVTNMAAVCFFVAGYQTVLPWFYTIKFPILVGARFFYYRARSWHWFLFDFCYFANAFLIVFLWAVPDNPDVFIIVFSLMNGPVLWAIVVFGNSLVFHSVDKTTSLFIHIEPVLVCFVMRWYPAASKFVICNDISCSSNFMYTLLYPTCFFAAHQLLYFVVIQGCLKSFIVNDPNALTSYRYLFRKRAGPAYRLISLCGPKLRIIMFGLWYTVFAAVSMLPTILYYHYWPLHAAMVVLALGFAVWNGSGFYTEMLRLRRMKEIAEDKKHSHSPKPHVHSTGTVTPVPSSTEAGPAPLLLTQPGGSDIPVVVTSS